MLNKKNYKYKNKIDKKRKYNLSIKSAIKTLIKKVNLYINNKNKIMAKKEIILTQSFIDRQSKKNIISKNKSSRLKSRLMKKINLI